MTSKEAIWEGEINLQNKRPASTGLLLLAILPEKFPTSPPYHLLGDDPSSEEETDQDEEIPHIWEG